jgi:hypothetical protein
MVSDVELDHLTSQQLTALCKTRGLQLPDQQLSYAELIELLRNVATLRRGLPPQRPRQKPRRSP